MLHHYPHQRLNIALVADWQYQMPMETTIKSIACHNRNFSIYILNPDIPREWFHSTNAHLAPFNSQIFDIKIDPDRLSHQHLSQPHLNLMSNARLLIPDLLPVDRVLFMDCDLIVRRSLLPLFNTDLQNHAVAAVQEADGDNFNAGVMLLNLTKIRQLSNIVQRLLKYGERPDLDNGDETVMNHFFRDDLVKLSAINNMQVGLEKPWEIAVMNQQPGAQAKLNHQRQLLEQLDQAVIVHYLTSVKPWATVSYSRCRQLWWQYHDLTWSAIINNKLIPALQNDTPQLLAWTDTDNLPALAPLIKAMPSTTITLCAAGSVSHYLIELLRYPNFRLFPGILNHSLDQFADHCQAYLDLNAGNKNYQLLQKLVDRGCPIYSFANVQTAQLKPYFNYHVFANQDIPTAVNELDHLTHPQP